MAWYWELFYVVGVIALLVFFYLGYIILYQGKPATDVSFMPHNKQRIVITVMLCTAGYGFTMDALFYFGIVRERWYLYIPLFFGVGYFFWELMWAIIEERERNAPPAPLPEPPPEPYKVTIPYDLRTEHVHVVASTGHGKSQLFQNMIIDDFEHDNAIIVIDSQNDLVNDLAIRVPIERLVLIDPVNCPPGLNLFALPKSQTSLSLIEYMFNSHDAKLTSKQAMCFRFLGRAIIEKGGNISDLITYLQHPEQAPTTSTNQAAAAFFAEYQKPKGQFTETRQEIMRRVLTLLENETMQEMLTSDLRINIANEIKAGKVILINTAKPQMGGEAATLFGRFFVAQIIQAVMQGSRRRVHLYIDEFQDYAEDSEIMQTLFTQSRKYNLGMVIAHQSLSQLPEGLRPSIMTNTSTKLIGSTSVDDASALGRQIGLDPKYMQIGKGLFWLWVRGRNTQVYSVEFGRLAKLPKLNILSFAQSRMRELYGVQTKPPQPTPPPAPPSVFRKRTSAAAKNTRAN